MNARRRQLANAPTAAVKMLGEAMSAPAVEIFYISRNMTPA